MSRNNIPYEPYKGTMGAINWCWALSTRCRYLEECDKCPRADEAAAEFAKIEIEEKEDFKQLDLTHTRAWRRHKNYHKAKRKAAILAAHGHKYDNMGRLEKGKAYCDCHMCRYEQKHNIPKARYKEKHKPNYIEEYHIWAEVEHDAAVVAFMEEMEADDRSYDGLTKAHEVYDLVKKYRKNTWYGDDFMKYFSDLMKQDTF